MGGSVGGFIKVLTGFSMGVPCCRREGAQSREQEQREIRNTATNTLWNIILC